MTNESLEYIDLLLTTDVDYIEFKLRYGGTLLEFYAKRFTTTGHRQVVEYHLVYANGVKLTCNLCGVHMVKQLPEGITGTEYVNKLFEMHLLKDHYIGSKYHIPKPSGRDAEAEY